jgi:hypothetical protein
LPRRSSTRRWACRVRRDYDVGNDELPRWTWKRSRCRRCSTWPNPPGRDLRTGVHPAGAGEAASGEGRLGAQPVFGGGFAWQGQQPDSLYNTWNFGLTLTWNFFQGGLTYGRVREAEQNVQSATAAVSVQRLQVRFDVEQAEATLVGNKETVVAAGDAVFNAKEQLRLAEGRYQAGIGTIIELSDAQVQLTQASAQLVQAQYNLATARAKLLAALGRQE